MVDVAALQVITAATFNGLQSRIENVLGSGFTDTGYGQTPSSSIVAVNTLITATHVDNLRSDINKCRTHQTGSTSTLGDVVATDRIGATASISKDGTTDTSKGINDYLAEVANLEGDKQLCSDTQASIEAAISSTRSTPWNGTIIHTFSATFSSADARRHFFNAGGEIRITGQLSNGSNAKDSDWANMLAAIGTIKIGSHATTQTGSGSGTAIGNYELTATSQRIFHKLGVAYQYDDNIYIVNAKTLADNVIQIEIQYQDIHPNGAGVDPNITGTIVSAITQRRASGSSVTTPSPTYTNIVTF
jgi:hypothetical protein|tara:strand:- start:716 stop:1624 length:909 start_codon:yes stop_codon:yes gene_type:complete